MLTSDSEHDYEECLNLARHLKLTAINQLWVADITYIRLQREFVYLAVVLDAFSRKAIGWELGRTLEAELTIAALERAIAGRKPPPGLVHHSDRGVQYACHGYRLLLEQHQMLASMSRPANPYDNAGCESFIKTLKREEIYANSYGDLEDLRSHIAEFIDDYQSSKAALGAELSTAAGVRAGLRGFRSNAGAGPNVEFFQASGYLSIRCGHVPEGEAVR